MTESNSPGLGAFKNLPPWEVDKPEQPVQDPFPKQEADFKDDYRVSYDIEKAKYTLETDSGVEYEWIPSIQKWTETIDEALYAQQQSGYISKEVDDKSIDEVNKKRKADAEITTKETKKSKPDKPNTSVFVTGLPDTADKIAVARVFKKCGLFQYIIDEDSDDTDPQPKIKVYTDLQGNSKGEALITFFKPESVNLAITLLDGTDFENGGSGTMHVEAADPSYKKEKIESKSKIAPDAPRKSNKEVVRKIKEMTNSLNKSLGDWSGDKRRIPLPQNNRWSNYVIVKNAFKRKEIEEDPLVVKDIEEDMREEAVKFGTVDKITVYEDEPEGVVTISWRTGGAPAKFVAANNGRTFAGGKLVAYQPGTE